MIRHPFAVDAVAEMIRFDTIKTEYKPLHKPGEL